MQHVSASCHGGAISRATAAGLFIDGQTTPHRIKSTRKISALPVLNAYAQGKANALTSILLTDRNAWRVMRRGDAQSELVLRTASKSRLLGRFDQTCSATDGLAAAHSWTA